MCQENCDAFLLAAQERGVGPIPRQALVKTLRDLADYRPALTETYAPNFRPWKNRASSRIVSVAGTFGQNRTPWVPNDVFDAVLAGALFLVQTASADIIDAHRETLRLSRRKLGRSQPKSVEARLKSFLDERVRCGRPLPRRRNDLRSPYFEPESDPLHDLNFKLLTKLAGASVDRRHLTAIQRDILEAAVSEVGLADGGLDIRPCDVLHADGTSGPWREPFDPQFVRDDARLLAAACFIVIAGLTGLRASEVAELRRGCIERVDMGDDQVCYRLRSRVVKNRRHGGDEETWTVIEPVVQAVRVLEQLAQPDAPVGAPLIHSGLPSGHGVGEPPVFSDWMAGLCAWVNEHWERCGLTPIPTDNGIVWKLNARQLRRTLARQLAFRPHGTIASKVHLKHISATVTEGYWGPPGESAAAFLEEVEAESEKARVERGFRQYQDWQAGSPLAGGASKRTVKEYERIEREMEQFQGTVEQTDRQLRLLLRKQAGIRHIGLLNDCHFIDPTVARCVISRGLKTADEPLINACQPDRCPNALITREHLPQWREPLAQIEHLLTDRKVPKPERERLRAERDRIQNIIDPLEEKPNP